MGTSHQGVRRVLMERQIPLAAVEVARECPSEAARAGTRRDPGPFRPGVSFRRESPGGEALLLELGVLLPMVVVLVALVVLAVLVVLRPGVWGSGF